MRILAINCGSSSIKSALIDSASGARLLDVRVTAEAASGLLDEVRRRLGAAGNGDSTGTVPGRDCPPFPPDAVVHRIVHGGERFRAATLVDEGVTRELESLGRLAPLHNPPALAALQLARTSVPRRPACRGLRYLVPRHLAAGARASTRCPKPSAPATAPVGTASTASATRT